MQTNINRGKMAANISYWSDAHYNQITATEDVALDFLREQNLVRSLQNPPSEFC